MKKNAIDNWMKAFGNNLFEDGPQDMNTNQLSSAADQPKNAQVENSTETIRKNADNT